MSFKLTIAPVKPADIPAQPVILSAGESLLKSTSSWKPGKTYHKTVKTYSRGKETGDGAPWHCRVSEHPPAEATFDQMWSKLGTDKAVNEKEYVSDINKVAKVKDISPTQSIWTLYYKFTPPIQPRVFTVLQVVHLTETSPRTGTVVSIPIDLSSPEDADLAKLEEKGVKGRYVSVEQLIELENGNTEWRMATSSTPGGLIPSFLAEATMNSTIAEDVPHFMKWLHSLPSESK
ncbi:uncharacterized protein BT62DRAFT_891131 [Guyanagaster necrorhizus]|uniref:DUF3074 domain-containing protein n=1 Tax=Guyanagaster necrorhizus TaxID=856835 RepID=A0A9P8AUF4_9AGAR|nr:uncharacterized protein BT62DRAFT_891131 [Guyanagaster necrorhizus MCA 3950]KAG7447996.1 hypothetical protein BT62DRAFT_891131 [Guyanagaster necrorhizus MCA 3950]